MHLATIGHWKGFGETVDLDLFFWRELSRGEEGEGDGVDGGKEVSGGGEGEKGGERYRKGREEEIVIGGE